MYDSSNRRKPNYFQHESNGTTTITLIQRKTGLVLTCVIDTADFDLVKDRRWYADKGAYTFYAKSTYPTMVKMHQLILPGVKLIDHKNENGLDNRRENLRPATRSLNAINTTKKRTSGKTSKFPGVHRDGDKFVAAIRINGKYVYYRTFDSEIDAANARAEELRKRTL